MNSDWPNSKYINSVRTHTRTLAREMPWSPMHRIATNRIVTSENVMLMFKHCLYFASVLPSIDWINSTIYCTILCYVMYIVSQLESTDCSRHFLKAVSWGKYIKRSQVDSLQVASWASEYRIELACHWSSVRLPPSYPSLSWYKSLYWCWAPEVVVCTDDTVV